MKYDLENRTLKFSANTLASLRKIKISIMNENMIRQLLRSSTSVGANYREANGATSKKDFRNKIHLCKKEIKETEYWPDLLSGINTELVSSLSPLQKEDKKLKLIFNKIASTLSEKSA